MKVKTWMLTSVSHRAVTSYSFIAGILPHQNRGHIQKIFRSFVVKFCQCHT